MAGGWWTWDMGAKGTSQAPSSNADRPPAHLTALKPRLASFLEAKSPKYAGKSNQPLLAEQLTQHLSGV